MHVFVSHSVPDRDAAARLRADLAQLGRQVVLDRGEPVGPRWWESVLQRLQRCAVFVLLVSPSSVRSPGCLAQLRYARALRRPVLLVPVRPAPLPPDAEDAPVFDPAGLAGPERLTKLRRALMSLPAAPPLPDPLPPDPPVPYLDPLRERLADPGLDQTDLREIFDELRGRLRDEHERPAVWGLLVRLRARPGLPPSLLAEVEKVLAPGWQPDPERRVEKRYWDGQAWTTLVRHEGREFNERRVPPPEATWPGDQGLVRARPTPTTRPVPRPRRRRWQALTAAAALVAAAAVGGYLFFRMESDAPGLTVREFVDAVNVADTAALSHVLCERDQGRERELYLRGDPRMTLERVEENTDPPTFTVLATSSSTSRTDRRTYPLVLEAGQWRVCSPAR
ncbi:toll/interleukin-1 receptor domain-containing protein [Actinokineospora iranica]|uniref:TIR domain-containing protein n=1 Tax=Actinokineospora iranica TaxID=1271860 RepID=A0A1G6JFL4_9PSEU|nr:toll/interleukin-1 receptor domain-containing protein [Actinokineospora iranica]SDC17443.1 Protein of unknown function [Actinokineospora iranica]